jgi:type II secretion system protein C
MDLSLMPSASPSGRDLSPHVVEQLEKLLSRRWVALLINLAALVLLCASLAHWTWRLWQPVVPPVTPSATRTNGAAEFNLDALLSTNLFGHAAPAANGTVVLENIPPSSLNLVLSGVMVTPAGSFALISADGGPETPFAVGEDIVGGTTLYAVYADRALIRRGGATESLMLKDTGPALPGGSVVLPSATPARSAASATPEVQRLGGNTYSVNREQMNRQLQKPEFLSQALMVPNAGGGFLVREVQAGSLYEKLGLRVGDVIQSVNGQAVNTVDEVMKLYQQFSAGGTSQVSVDIRRAGKSESLQYNLQ